jgi:hypothetical protein
MQKLDAPSGWGNIMRSASVAILLVASLPAAAETCYIDPGGQYGKITMCVSSVLPPQGANSYGPEHMIGRSENENTAWCAGVTGPGIGETITEKLDCSYTARALSITNGYAKSDEAFRGNGRIKSAVIETSRGYKATMALKDTREPQKVSFPKSKIAWIKLTIADVYPDRIDVRQFRWRLPEPVAAIVTLEPAASFSIGRVN